MQSFLHASLLFAFPSSHCSPPSTKPSPHTGTVVVVVVDSVVVVVDSVVVVVSESWIDNGLTGTPVSDSAIDRFDKIRIIGIDSKVQLAMFNLLLIFSYPNAQLFIREPRGT